ncbi:MAG TPA: type IX secretion system protein PorQ [Cytophagaceae bacterium]|nr:type IX secretion system protein PorQ [Cytophagaceae bacterium]
MKKNIFITIVVCLLSARVFSQSAGKSSFEFVNLPSSAHVAGIGGMNISTYDRDVNMVWQNPALLRDTMKRFLSVTYLPFYASVKGGTMSYAHKFRKVGTIAASIQYIDYGTMDQTDETGNVLGTFHPQDLAFMLAKSHTIGLFTLGGTLKYVASVITPSYSSYALMADIGGVFKHPVRDFTIGLTMKNIGAALVKYDKGAPTYTPFDVQLGTSYRLEHLPVRFSLTAHHLDQLNIVYNDTSQNVTYDLNGNEIVHKTKLGDEIIRHFVVGTEIFLTRGLHFRCGYNFQLRRELLVQNKPGGAGLSWGFLLRVKSFEFEFTRATYHIVGGKNWITVSMDMNRIFGRN